MSGGTDPIECWGLGQYGIALTKKPPGWVLAERRDDGAMWVNKKRGLSVIVSISYQGDGHAWAHASIAHVKRLPTYDELKYLHRHWLGEQRKAIQVFAPSAEHVNIHPRCLHLWCCLDGDPLPDFTAGGGSI